MDDNDPISQFFPDQEDVDLYAVLGVKQDANADDIKKAYRKLALKYHPDKHAGANEDAKADASLKFQQLGFAYAVLSDEKRRGRYDLTGKTDEGADFGPGEDGWETYFEQLFEEVTRDKLDAMKKEYQGSAEELQDLKQAYIDTSGSIAEMMTHIPHSTFDDEARFIVAISDMIKKGELPLLPQWESSTKDEKARLVRKKQASKEAKEAEELAKELGVHDEFFGSGKKGARKGKSKGKEKQTDEEDTSALQALILKKRKNAEGLFDNIAAKYAQAESAGKGAKKGKKRSKAAEDEEDGEEEASPKKRSRKDIPPPPDIDDAEFEKVQQRLMESKPKRAADSGAGSKGTTKGRAAKGRKAK
ncbi:DnaJ-domain-containing protein [Dichomitus squalens LYAD-421 SS1]|uniref:DnaJ-domain-containing protein n=1 Tax=Dichomitus squalens (strain LYAD-421) TaxID=732165 RepID=UPI000441093E|nr:DnaJ-domain-containing protein [Dichomitus squalens LYAD-421 SS1]EJF65797.1 DnaJ-domain-containing protein [Dichomitus squalens LYAD-421 SS1]